MFSKKRGILAASVTALALVGVTALAGCSAAGGSDGDGDVVRIGVVGASDPYWETFTEAASEEGIEVKIIDFADYNQPNPALSEGELDLNQFQHIVYLADYNVANDDDLTILGSTAIYPLGVFSTQHEKLSELTEGSTVAIPSDPSNRARALNVLQSAGLVELSDGGTLFTTPDEVIADKSKVQVTEMDAAFTATSLADVDAAVVNNDFVTDAGLEFADALYQDDPEDAAAQLFTNVFAVKSADVDNKTYKKLVEIYQTNEAVQAGVFENSGNSGILLSTPVSELQALLADAEEQVRASN